MFLIKERSSIKEALFKINQLSPLNSRTLFVLNDKNNLIGSITDGDIRRALLDGKQLESAILPIMCRDVKFLKEGEFYPARIKSLRESGIFFVPLLDEQNCIIDIIDLNKKRSILPVDVLIMAGGEGRRLLPLTQHTPKPMLKLGNKPIIEYNVDNLVKYGVKKINISVKYLSEQIVNYFKDGSGHGTQINYILEDKPLGTIGALGLIDSIENEYVLIMNSDLLTNIDFEDLFLSFINEKADMIIASIPYEIKIPYAIFELKEEQVKGLNEKPTYTYYSNAGIYLIKKEACALIEANKKMDATDLIEELVKRGKKVITYPILGYWLDIGTKDDFEKAINDIKHIVI